MENQIELNHKLADWAGVELVDVREGFTNEGRVAFISELYSPNFPTDLNACFRHLEPELYKRGYRYQLTRLQDGHKMNIIKSSEAEWVEVVTFAFEKEASMAFSKAIEKLIDKEEAQ